MKTVSKLGGDAGLGDDKDSQKSITNSNCFHLLVVLPYVIFIRTTNLTMMPKDAYTANVYFQVKGFLSLTLSYN